MQYIGLKELKEIINQRMFYSFGVAVYSSMLNKYLENFQIELSFQLLVFITWTVALVIYGVEAHGVEATELGQIFIHSIYKIRILKMVKEK